MSTSFHSLSSRRGNSKRNVPSPAVRATDLDGLYFTEYKISASATGSPSVSITRPENVSFSGALFAITAEDCGLGGFAPLAADFTLRSINRPLASVGSLLNIFIGFFPIATGIPEMGERAKLGADSRSATSIGNGLVPDAACPI